MNENLRTKQWLKAVRSLKNTVFIMGDMEHVIDQGRRWSESPPGDLEKLEFMI